MLIQKLNYISECLLKDIKSLNCNLYAHVQYATGNHSTKHKKSSNILQSIFVINAKIQFAAVRNVQ